MRALSLTVAFLVVALSVSCADDPPTAPTRTPEPPTTTTPVQPVQPPEDPDPVVEYEFSPEPPTNMMVGDTGHFRVNIIRDGVSERLLEGVTSSAPSVLRLNLEGDRYRYTGERTGASEIRVSHDGERRLTHRVQVEPPPGPETSFRSGTWIVNEDIAPGRYYTNPRSGCYWERLSGLGGTLSDVIANEFIGFDSGQEIVDIASSDRAFDTDADCGRWDMTPEAGPASGTIRPGRWLVGRQIQPGDYETHASSGCYWERLRSFTGETSRSVIANDFVGGGGRIIVSIRSSDAGFYTDDDCGTWSRRGGSSSQTSQGATDSFRIEQNYRRHRSSMGR